MVSFPFKLGSTQEKKENLTVTEEKISEHRGLLLTVFPYFTLHPKHHFVEHYPQLMRMYGPLRDMWTMRFEEKHKFFKQVIHNTKKSKNVPQTLAVQHQRMMAYYVDSYSLFKPSIQMDEVSLSLVSSLPENIQKLLKQRYVSQNTVLIASSVSVDGIKYSLDMIVSVGACSFLPDFRQIHNILIIYFLLNLL